MLGEWKFKPTIGPTLFAVPTFIILILLGSWQVQRMSWKQDIIASFEQQMAKQPVTPPLDIKKDTDWRYTRVRATGRFLHDKEILLTGRTFEGTAGFHIVTPFLFNGGQIVLINRGWIQKNFVKGKADPKRYPRVLSPWKEF